MGKWERKKKAKVENREPVLSAQRRQVEKTENKEDNGGVAWPGICC